jgi:hypothetical protein
MKGDYGKGNPDQLVNIIIINRIYAFLPIRFYIPETYRSPAQQHQTEYFNDG